MDRQHHHHLQSSWERGHDVRQRVRRAERRQQKKRQQLPPEDFSTSDRGQPITAFENVDLFDLVSAKERQQPQPRSCRGNFAHGTSTSESARRRRRPQEEEEEEEEEAAPSKTINGELCHRLWPGYSSKTAARRSMIPSIGDKRRKRRLTEVCLSELGKKCCLSLKTRRQTNRLNRMYATSAAMHVLKR